MTLPGTQAAKPNGREPARILYVEANEDGTVGGSHRSLFELVRRLDRSYYDPTVLYYQDNVYADYLRSEGVRVIHYAAERDRERAERASGSRLRKTTDIAAAVLRRAALLRRERMDMVHINNSPVIGCDDWLPACRLVGIPIVASVRGDAHGEPRRWRRPLFRRFDRVMAVSDWIGRAMVDAGIHEKRVRVVRNGVDVAGIRSRVRRSREQVRARLGVRDDALLAVMGGTLRRWKGQHVVLEALSLVDADVPVVLAFAGGSGGSDAEYVRELKAFVAEHDLGERVLFLGQRGDVPDLFAAADVVVHSSILAEPFGLVIVEALAVGTPVIASNSGGPTEILTPACGFTHDPADPRQLAALLERLAEEPDTLAAMRQAASRRAHSFDIQWTVRRMQRVYDEIFGCDRPPGPAPDEVFPPDPAPASLEAREVVEPRAR